MESVEKRIFKDAFDREVNTLEDLLRINGPLPEINARFAALTKKFEKLNKLEQTALKTLLEQEEVDESQIQMKYKEMDQLEFKFNLIKETIKEHASCMMQLHQPTASQCPFHVTSISLK